MEVSSGGREPERALVGQPRQELNPLDDAPQQSAQGPGLPSLALGSSTVPCPSSWAGRRNTLVTTLPHRADKPVLSVRRQTQKRGGWVREGVQAPESIADHMYRMAVLALCAPSSSNGVPLDVGKCVMMSVVHDLAEAHVGDITPVDGVSKADKHRMEGEAMDSFLGEMLGPGEAADRIRTLWDVRLLSLTASPAATASSRSSPAPLLLGGMGLLTAPISSTDDPLFPRASLFDPGSSSDHHTQEYEGQQTAEARFVKDLDRLELTLQTVEYERCTFSFSLLLAECSRKGKRTDRTSYFR
jgi:5'-deoxynucleotidase YfbR-like HD superfamily hydrolase